MSQSKTIVCPGCTCLCDDIEVAQNGSSILAKNACETGQAFFDFRTAKRPTHNVENRPTDLDSALNVVAKLLNQSQAPLVCGLEQLTAQSQQIAWKIADQIGATIDTTFTNHERSTMFVLQRVGKITASFGEVANRSDLVVFWFCDPESTHPRFLERLSRSGGPKRRIVVIGENAFSTANKADEFLPIDGDKASAVLAVLRAVLKGISLDADLVQSATGLELSELQLLAAQLRSAKYGSLIYGQAHADSAFDLVTDSLISLVRELNNMTRFVGLKLRSDTNAQSAENVLSWSSGYPFAVNHNQGFPRFNWLEHSAESVLRRRECDAVLFATGSHKQQEFDGISKTSREFMETIPTIALSPIANFPSSVSIQVATPGLECDGEFCRFDGVTLPLTSNSNQKSESVNAETILNVLLEKIGSSAPQSI